MLHHFPFRIRGFHCDNGSEFINHTASYLLEKLRVEFTKSRAYRTTDQIGYGPIAAEHAEAFQKFYTESFNPYVKYHRPVWLRAGQNLGAGPASADLSAGGVPDAV